MKRVLFLIAAIALIALAFSCGSAVGSHAPGIVSAAAEKLSPAIEKAKELLPSSDGSEGQAADDEGTAGWSLPSLSDIGFTSGTLGSADDVVLVPADDYGQNYVFEYGGEQFSAYYDGNSWRVYDSYRITSHGDIVAICQALINEHPVYGSDWMSFRTAEDMAYEWEQHNLAYKLLPEGNHWREDAKDVDLDPDDQGKSIEEMYESRTGEKLDISRYLS